MEEIVKEGGYNGVAFFLLRIDGHEAGRMTVSFIPGFLRAGHTVVDIAHRRSGYGRKLVNAMVDYACENNLKVIPSCGFVAMLFDKYPEQYGTIRGTLN